MKFLTRRSLLAGLGAAIIAPRAEATLQVNQLDGFNVAPAPPPAGGGFSCMMTAGTDGVFNGYDIGIFADPIGSIDTEPIPGQTLAFILSGGANVITFSGNVLSSVTGLKVWIDGVEYPFTGSDWSFDGSFTSGEWTSAGPTFVSTTVYFLEIK